MVAMLDLFTYPQNLLVLRLDSVGQEDVESYCPVEPRKRNGHALQIISLQIANYSLTLLIKRG